MARALWFGAFVAAVSVKATAPIYSTVSSLSAAAAATAGAVPSVTLCDGTTLPVYHGTTTLAFTFEGGIVVAVDSRASLGALVGSSTTDKVLPVSDRILGTMAGGAADCAYWIRVLTARMQLWELQEGRPATATLAAETLASLLRQNAGRGLSVGTMICGPDASGAPAIYYLDDAGSCVRGEAFAVGSGSPYAASVLDSAGVHRHRRPGTTPPPPPPPPPGLDDDDDDDDDGGAGGGGGEQSLESEGAVARRRRQREGAAVAPSESNLGCLSGLSGPGSLEEAVQVAVAAIQRATHRDAFSGGYVNVYHIPRGGGRWRQVKRVHSGALAKPQGFTPP